MRFLRIATATLFVLLLAPSMALPQKSAVLTGWTNIPVVTETVSEDARGAGIIWRVIQTQVQLRLLESGVDTTLPEPPDIKCFLYVSVTFAGSISQFTASVRVEFKEWLELTNGVEAFASTWSSGKVFAGGVPEFMARELLDELLDEFLNDWHKANPRESGD